MVLASRDLATRHRGTYHLRRIRVRDDGVQTTSLTTVRRSTSENRSLALYHVHNPSHHWDLRPLRQGPYAGEGKETGAELSPCLIRFSYYGVGCLPSTWRLRHANRVLVRVEMLNPMFIG
jgi:hypothetical protein